jgi:CRP-like cAMP-binding protein
MRLDDQTLGKLRGLQLFRGLERTELEEVVALAHERRVPAGEVIFREGEEGNEMFVLLRGGVGLEKSAEEEGSWKVAQVGEGAVFGEMALLTNEPRSLTAIALSDAVLMSIARGDFERVVAETRAIAIKLLRNLATVVAYRLRKMDEELHRFYVYDARRDRKIAEIIRLKDRLLSQWEG